MLCTNGHNNVDSARYCVSCGVDTFTPGSTIPTNVAVVASVAPSTNGLAIASMVLGILWLGGLGAILALVFGYVSRRQIKESGEGGAGMALAGIILGWIGVAVIILYIAFLVALIAAFSHAPASVCTPPGSC